MSFVVVGLFGRTFGTRLISAFTLTLRHVWD
jgi:hypothetical protein